MVESTLTIPYKSPRMEEVCIPYNAKRRKSELEEFTTTPNSSKQQEVVGTQSPTRQNILSIELITQTWLGFPIYEAMATLRCSRLVKENDDFLTADTPLSESNEFWTLHHAFTIVSQQLYPHERLDVVLRNYLLCTQLPRDEKVNQDTNLCDGFHIIICFDGGFKNMRRSEARGACLEQLHMMDI